MVLIESGVASNVFAKIINSICDTSKYKKDKARMFFGDQALQKLEKHNLYRVNITKNSAVWDEVPRIV